MNEFQIKSLKQVFRIKKMNAIETLALRSQINTENVEKAVQFYNTLLEKIEVKIGEKWLPVKEQGYDVYMPTGIEDNVKAIDELVTYFLHDYLFPIFTSSDESKN